MRGVEKHRLVFILPCTRAPAYVHSSTLFSLGQTDEGSRMEESLLYNFRGLVVVRARGGKGDGGLLPQQPKR